MNMLQRIEATRPFTEAEAWWLFRLAALAEAVGWTLLGTGILIEHFWGIDAFVYIGGRVHGTLFFSYLAACLVLYPSLGWSRYKALVALAFSVPPYGSLAFERYVAHRRRAHGFRTYRHYLVYTVLTVS